MAYIGKSPTGTGVRSRYYYTATGGETSLSGADDNSNTLVFSDGNYVDVSLNGIALVAGTDYNTSTANTIAGLSALSASDIVEIVVYDIFTVADTVSAKDGGTFSGNVAMGGTLSVTGASTLTGDLTVDTDTLYVDSTNNRVGIGTSSPDTIFHVKSSDSADTISRIENTVGYAANLNLKATGNYSFTTYEGGTKTWLAGQRGLSGGSFSIYDFDNTAHRLVISSTGDVTITGDSNAGYVSVIQAYTGTTSGAANLHILSSGTFLRSTSSGRYKTGIEDAEMSYAEELYNLRPVYYKSLGTFDNPNHGHWGFIAEEVAEIDPRLCLFKTTEPDLDDDGNVQYDDDGNIVETTLDEPVVEGVQYDRMIPLLLMLLKAEKDKVETLETKVATLETQNADFEARIAALENVE